MFRKVAVLMGGSSSERKISLLSGNAVVKALDAAGINNISVDPAQPDYLVKLIDGEVSHAFVALHGAGGEDGSIQGLLDSLGIPYTGSGILGSALAFDKIRAKKIMQNMGIATPPYAIWHSQTSYQDFISLVGFPICVKPIFEGSSFGVYKVNNMSELAIAATEAAKYGQVMLEPWIIGEEYTVGIVGSQDLPSIKILPEGSEFYDYEAKYVSARTKFICPSDLDSNEEQFLGRMALDVFNALGCQGWGRVDFMRDLNGDFWVLECNTVPGLTSHSLVPAAAKECGIDFNALTLEILDNCISVKPKELQIG